MRILTDVEFKALSDVRQRPSVASKLDTLLNDLLTTKKIVKGNKVQLTVKDIINEDKAHYYNASLMLKEKYAGKIDEVVFTMLPKAQFSAVAFIVL